MKILEDRFAAKVLELLGAARAVKRRQDRRTPKVLNYFGHEIQND
jgi:hypothetical protein